MNNSPLLPFIPTANPRYIIPVIILVVIFFLLRTYQSWLDSRTRKSKPKSAKSKRTLQKDFKKIFTMFNFSEEQKQFFKTVCLENSINNPLQFIHDPEKINTVFSKKLHHLDTLATQNPNFEKDKTMLFTIRNALEQQIKNKAPFISTRSILKNQEFTLITSTGEHYESKIVDNTEDGLITIVPRDVSNNELRLQQYAKIEIFFTVLELNQSYRFQTRLLQYISDEDNTYFLLAHSSSLQVLAVRKYERKSIELHCNFALVKITNVFTGKQTQHKYLPIEDSNPGLITDISIGGCTIKTKKSFPVQTYIQITTSIDSTNEDRMIARVVRLNQEDTISFLHVSFVQMPRITLNRIFSLFFS